MSPNVLLVDDDPIVRDVLAMHLRALGCRVTAASGVGDARAAARSSQFDHLFLDVRLGSTSGSALWDELRQHAGCENATAIAITADLDEPLRARLVAEGFADALLKPISRMQLANVLGLEVGGSPPPEGAPAADILDDDAALSIWGSMDTVIQLRRILLDELDGYRQSLLQACADCDSHALREILHRMKSSAGFCGARPLLHFIECTPATNEDWQHVLARYDDACTRLRPHLQAVLAS